VVIVVKYEKMTRSRRNELISSIVMLLMGESIMVEKIISSDTIFNLGFLVIINFYVFRFDL